MDQASPVLDLCLPVFGLVLYPHHGEEEMHEQANTPSNEGIEELDDLRYIHQVEGEQQGVDQGVDGRVNNEAYPLLLCSQFALSSLVLGKCDSVCQSNRLLFAREHSTGVSQAFHKTRLFSHKMLTGIFHHQRALSRFASRRKRACSTLIVIAHTLFLFAPLYEGRL